MIFGRDIGIDLGTATVLVSAVKGKASSRGGSRPSSRWIRIQAGF